MDTGEWNDLQQLTAALASDAVRIQARLDESNARELQAFAHVLANVPAEMRDTLLALAPPRLRVQRHEVRCSVRVAMRREVSFQLLVKPISLGFSLLHARSEGQAMSLSIEVEPVPFPPENQTESR